MEVMTMTDKELNELLLDNGYENVIIFDGFSPAFVGVSTDNQAVYDYSKMVDVLIKDGMDETEAMEYVDYNCVNCVGVGMPVVMFEI